MTIQIGSRSLNLPDSYRGMTRSALISYLLESHQAASYPKAVALAVVLLRPEPKRPEARMPYVE